MKKWIFQLAEEKKQGTSQRYIINSFQGGYLILYSNNCPERCGLILRSFSSPVWDPCLRVNIVCHSQEVTHLQAISIVRRSIYPEEQVALPLSRSSSCFSLKPPFPPFSIHSWLLYRFHPESWTNHWWWWWSKAAYKLALYIRTSFIYCEFSSSTRPSTARAFIRDFPFSLDSRWWCEDYSSSPLIAHIRLRIWTRRAFLWVEYIRMRIGMLVLFFYWRWVDDDDVVE